MGRTCEFIILMTLIADIMLVSTIMKIIIIKKEWIFKGKIVLISNTMRCSMNDSV